MRKYIIGILMGAVLATTISAHAEVINIMIGKPVDGALPFKINGQKVAQDVVVIEGTSYIPVRAAADMFGYDIDFDTTNKEVLMQSKGYKGLSDYEKAMRNTPSYKVTTNLQLGVDKYNSVELLSLDGESYIPLVPTFSKYAVWDGTSMTIKYDGKTISANKESKYVKGIDAFMENKAAGSFYIKLSAFGLKGTVTGDSLQVDKQ